MVSLSDISMQRRKQSPRTRKWASTGLLGVASVQNVALRVAAKPLGHGVVLPEVGKPLSM